MTRFEHVLVLIGGTANLAFREDEQLKPYKKKGRAILLSASLDDSSFTILAWQANAHRSKISQANRPEHEVRYREESADAMLMDDAESDMMTESMLTASSDIIVADDLDEISTLQYSSSPSDTAVQASAK